MSKNINIITVAHSKGGVGKSTLAWNLAFGLKQRGYHVTILDLDFQQTLYVVNKIRKSNGIDDITVLQAKNTNTIDDIYDVYRNTEGILIVDSGGYDNDINRYAIKNSDKVLVPISDSITEILGFKTFEAILNEIKVYDIDIVLNNIHPRKTNFEVVKKAIGSASKNVLDSIIRNRRVFRDSLGNGRSVFDTKVVNQKAIDEIQGVCDGLKLFR